MTEQVREWIKKYGMVQTGDLVVVGLSGGGDSVCLLYVLWELREALGITLAALHVHHGIRGAAADEDAAFCEKLCGKLGIPCRVVRVDVPAAAAAEKLSLEEAARRKRYEELETYRQELGAARIAVAHHRDDNAETVLWNLFRGSGLRGMSGIRPVNGYVIRPLLFMGREDIRQYLEAKKLSWRQDETNDSDDYTRNRIRRHILPYATEAVNGRAAQHICQAAAVAAQADAYLERQALRWLEEYGEKEREGQVRLNGSRLRQEEEILQSYVIREAVRRSGGLTDVTARHMAAVLGLLEERPGAAAGRCVTLGGGVTARRSYGELVLEKKRREAREAERRAEMEMARGIAVDLPDPADGTDIDGKRLSFGGYFFEISVFPYEKTQKIPSNRYTKWMDYDRIEKTLAFRSRRTGDYLLLADGRKKTIKTHMIDEKIPARERDRRILVAQGSHVLWVTGGRLSEGIKITENTKYVVQIKMYGGKSDGEDSGIDSGRRCGQEDQ